MKNIRLPSVIYSQPNQPCMITICTAKTTPLFTDHDFTVTSINNLNNLCKRFEFKLYCYCFMPDHVHFIISVRGSYSILNFVAIFKSLTLKKGKNLDINHRFTNLDFTIILSELMKI
ncbi:MAG: hypothetical protein GF307_11440 [candidate division Zixibacteria bacterium]|nr:hypothetical protein [candidate division Zixibacteria bacterium]